MSDHGQSQSGFEPFESGWHQQDGRREPGQPGYGHPGYGHPGYGQPGYGSPGHVSSYPPGGALQPTVSDTHVVVAWVVTAVTLGYMLPWAVAATRRKRNTVMIALVNVLAGWTFVGWVVALVLAFLSDPAPVSYGAGSGGWGAATAGGPGEVPAGWYPDGSGSRRYWDGSRWTEHTAPGA